MLLTPIPASESRNGILRKPGINVRQQVNTDELRGGYSEWG